MCCSRFTPAPWTSYSSRSAVRTSEQNSESPTQWRHCSSLFGASLSEVSSWPYQNISPGSDTFITCHTSKLARRQLSTHLRSRLHHIVCCLHTMTFTTIFCAGVLALYAQVDWRLVNPLRPLRLHRRISELPANGNRCNKQWWADVCLQCHVLSDVWF